MISEGDRAISITPKSLQKLLTSYKNIAEASAFMYSENGHSLYEVSFDNNTWVFDITESSLKDGIFTWSEKEALTGGRNIAQHHAFFNGEDIVGDYRSGNLYVIDEKNHTNNNEKIKRTRISTTFSIKDESYIRVNSIELSCKEGLDFINKRAIPAYLSLSKDRGINYSNKIPGGLGKTGKYKNKTIWRNAGVAQYWTFKIEYFGLGDFMIDKLLVGYDILK